MDELIKFPHLEKVMEEFAAEILAQYKYNLNSNNRFASRELMNTAEYVIDRGEYTYAISLKLKDYWIYVEDGRGPTKNGGNGELRRNILEWIRVKPVLPTPDKNGKLPTPEQLAYLISRKIHLEGTEGTHDLREATDDMYKVFEERIYQAIDEDLDAALITIFHY